MKQTRMLVAIVAGLASYFAFRYAAEYLLQRVTSPGPISVWTVLSTPINMLISLLPGFVAGWMCRRGLLAGFVVGLFGSGGYSVLVGSAAQYFSPQSSQSLLLASWFIAMCVVAGVFGAVAGGSAQLVRSNNSFKPKPLRGSA